MLSGIVRRYPLPVTYVALLGAVSAVYAHALPLASQRAFVGWASTNAANLAVRPVTTMVVSAFVTEDPLPVWAVVTTLGLFLVVRRFGNLRAAGLVLAGHVAGTLVSEGIAAFRVSVGDLPRAVTHMVDVGPSYVTVAALAAAALHGSRIWQRAAAGLGYLLLAPFLFEGLLTLEVAAVGHAVATATGVLLATAYATRDRRRRAAVTPEPQGAGPEPEAPAVRPLGAGAAVPEAAGS